jgi:hypothetical protein
MAESNADKNVESTSSSPVAPDETIKDLDVHVSEKQLNDVKGGAGLVSKAPTKWSGPGDDGPEESITF